MAIAEAPTGRIVQASAAATRMWGAAPHPARVADHRADFVGYRPGAAEPLASHEWPIARAVTAGEVVTDELYEFVRPDGERRLLSLSAGPVRDADGWVLGARRALQRDELYIAEQIVQAHDDRIDVASSQASGTTFTVCLPCRAELTPTGR